MGYTPHVLVVGGGPLGAGLARDFAIRGLDVTLADPGPLAAPRLGRMGGLLASGAQFAREDPQYARRCLAENRTLFETARHCVEDTGGLVVDDDLDAVQAACEACGIAARELSGAAAREREPGLGSAVNCALAVPDAAIDPFRLTVATARDAREYGADIRPRTAVTDIHVENGAVDSVRLRYDPLPDGLEHPDHEGDDTAETHDSGDRGGEATGTDSAANDSGDEEVRSDGGRGMPGTLDVDINRPDEGGEWPEPTVESLDVDYIVNVAGADAADVVALADCSIPVSQHRATVVVASDRPVGTAVTRPGEATPASVVPVGQQTLLDSGSATSSDTAGGSAPVPSSVDETVDRVSGLADGLAEGRTLRAFRTPRYEVGPGQGRDFVTADHGDQGCWGLLTVLGGTVTTHRWVAEQVCDRVCREFGIRRTCRTDELSLPGSEAVPDSSEAGEEFGLAPSVYEHSRRRLGRAASTVLDTDDPNPVLCPCQSVTRAEIGAALDDETAAEADLGSVRVRTSATVGDCQGGRCAHRLAAELHPEYALDVVEGACRDLLAERWQGQRPVTGPQITGMARNYRLHMETMNRGHESVELTHEDLAAFDDGVTRTAERPTCCPRVGWEP